MIIENESESSEDVTSQAGWLYTDLLLGLMVIFLATISFIPIESRISLDLLKNDPRDSKQIQLFEDSVNDLTILLKDDGAINIDAELGKFVSGIQDKPNREIAFFQVIGGFDPRTGKEADGILTAIKYASKVKVQYPKLFHATQSTLGASIFVPKNQALVRITFTSK